MVIEKKLKWYVVHTKSRAENVVTKGLKGKSIDVFYPRLTVHSKRKDRKKMIEVPLFPGYLFVRSQLMPDEHLAILKTPGAVKLIGGPSGPVPVGDEEIDSLKIMINSGHEIITTQCYKAGDRVIVIYGPFTGVSGVFSEYRGQGRVLVNIELMGQAASVYVSEDEIKKID